MSNRLNQLVVAMLAFFSAFAFCQPVIQATSAILEPQVKRDTGGFKSCGVRALVSVVSGKNSDVYDFSIMIDSEFSMATIKAGMVRNTIEAIMNGKGGVIAITPAPKNFWFVEEAEGKAITPIKLFPGDTKGYVLGFTPLDSTFRALLEMIKGTRMQFAARYEIEPVDRVITFSASLSNSEFGSMMNCLEKVVNRMDAEAKVKLKSSEKSEGKK